MRRVARRGNVATVVALSMVMLLGFVALVVDVGHFWMVKGELQNGVDAAALAAVRDLDGTAPKLDTARATAQDFGLKHRAYQSPIDLELNPANDPAGEVVLGSWDFTARTFLPAGPATPPYQVNAVQVTARRAPEEGGAVATTFGAILGKAEQSVSATAIAVGGSPGRACGFPLAVTDCSVMAPDGTLRCDQTLTFGQATTDTVGFTVYSNANPTTPSVTCMVARDLGTACPGNCDCAGSCNAAATTDGEIRISNGNNLSQTAVDAINEAVLMAGADGLYVEVALIDSGGMLAGTCGSFNYNQPHRLTGFVEMKLTGATFAPDKAITATIDCTHQGAEAAGGYFYGYRSTKVYLVK